MSELLVPVDSELALLLELNAGYPVNGFPGVTLAGKTLGTKLPTATPRPADFVRVLSVGGAARDLVADSPTLVVEGWALKEARARDLCALGVGIAQAAGRDGVMGGFTCYRVDVFSLPANLPDPTVTTHFRYTATISVDLRRATV